MKISRLTKHSLNIQKCLLPDCEFLKQNYGSYCIVTTNKYGFLVKIGLCEPKYIHNTVFLDDSVSVFSSFDKIKKIDLTNASINNFIVLNKPLIAKSVKVIIVFGDIFHVKKYKLSTAELRTAVRDILKLYTICNKSIVVLNNLQKHQNFGIYCVAVVSIESSKPNQCFTIDLKTEIQVENCISELKFKQLLETEKELQVGGCNRVYGILKEMIELAKCFEKHKLKLVRKVLLTGPSGCGKTTLVRNLATKCECVLLEVSASDINAMTINDIEQKLKNVFEEATIYADNQDCCIILIEDVDLISVGKTAHSKQFVKQLSALLENVEHTPQLVVIATTNCPDDVDAELRKPKRLEDELEIMMPMVEDREDIARKLLDYCGVRLGDGIVYQLSKWTPGFVGADLRLVLVEALMAVNKKQGSLDLSDNDLLQNCIKQALKKVIPSALKGAVGLCIDKDASFSQIGGLSNIKKILDLSVKQQLENPQRFRRLGVPLTKGILLYGPPGCAKTTLVKALAKECNATFLATSAADLYSPFVGDAEKKIVQLFTQARVGSPSIVFIDEIDAVVGSKSGDRESGVQERILSTLLIEMDGVGLKVSAERDNSLNLLASGERESSKTEINNGVIVIGATNRPQLLDDALKRPGRFDRLLYVPPPDEPERLRIIEKFTEKMSLHESVDLGLIAKRTSFYSGADLKNLCQESGLHALTCTNMTADCVHQSHFEHILGKYKPSLSEEVIRFYEYFQKYND